jgi:hypothetical protein
MSLLVEIATRADVPLESVVRVLTREAVNDEHKARVLAVLDHLDAEETRVLQRFALAAVHDALPPGGFARLDHESVVAELVEAPLELPEAVRFDVEPVRSTEVEEARIDDERPGPAERLPAETGPAQVEAAPLVQLGSVLTELTEAVRELRHETDAERRERVDDLAVLIDLITKGWEGVDRRLGRVERQLGRLESAPPARTLPAAPPPPLVEPPPVPDPEPPPPPPEGERDGSTLRRRLPIIAAIAFGVAIGALAARDLGSRFDAAAIVGERSTAEAARREGTRRAQLPVTVAQQRPVTPPTTAVTVPKRAVAKPSKPPARTAPSTAAARTAPAPGTTAAATTQAATTAQPAPRPRAPAARTTAPRPATTAAPAKQPPPPDFTPSRNWAWPPAEGADYYLVEFFRSGQPLYKARPTEPRLTLPESIEFTPGVYRWRVRPGHGAPAENRLDAPIVDSEFILNG